MITREDIITVYDSTPRDMSDDEKAIRIMLLFGIELDQFVKELKKIFDDFTSSNPRLISRFYRIESGKITINLEMVLLSEDERDDIDKILSIFCDYLKIRCYSDYLWNRWDIGYSKAFINFYDMEIND